MEKDLVSNRKEAIRERGECSGSVPIVDQTGSAYLGLRDESKIPNFIEPGQGSASGNQIHDAVKDKDKDHPQVGNSNGKLKQAVDQGQSSYSQTKEGEPEPMSELMELKLGLQDQEHIFMNTNFFKILSDDMFNYWPKEENPMGDGFSDSGDFWDEDYIEDDEDDYYDDFAEVDDGQESNLNKLEVEKFDLVDPPPEVVETFPWWKELTADKIVKKSTDDEIANGYRNFKPFDVIKDYSDHHFFKKEIGIANPRVNKPSKDWVKRIQHEWKLLEKDLPETILVRVYEERMDLLRAVIIGPPGTPYHDGLFFFDCCFPCTYPNSPPMVYYHSGGLRLNPNLYASGKVCLSLLGTWSGDACERWIPKESTMLQVLISIQALVLNSEPYFNEPGHEGSRNTPAGSKHSVHYNEQTFLFSCKTMLYSIRNPPKNFEEFIERHFRERGRDILTACRAYIDGMKVGKEIGVHGPEADPANVGRSVWFRSSLAKLFEELLLEFSVKGADCRYFLMKKVDAKLVEPSGSGRLGSSLVLSMN